MPAAGLSAATLDVQVQIDKAPDKSRFSDVSRRLQHMPQLFSWIQ